MCLTLVYAIPRWVKTRSKRIGVTAPLGSVFSCGIEAQGWNVRRRVGEVGNGKWEVQVNYLSSAVSNAAHTR